MPCTNDQHMSMSKTVVVNHPPVAKALDMPRMPMPMYILLTCIQAAHVLQQNLSFFKLLNLVCQYGYIFPPLTISFYLPLGRLGLVLVTHLCFVKWGIFLHDPLVECIKSNIKQSSNVGYNFTVHCVRCYTPLILLLCYVKTFSIIQYGNMAQIDTGVPRLQLHFLLDSTVTLIYTYWE